MVGQALKSGGVVRWLPALLIACGPWRSGESDGLRTLEHPAWSTPSGDIVLRFDVEDDETSFAASFAVPQDNRVFVQSITNPEGELVFFAEDWWESPYKKTNAAFSAATTTLVWPVSPQDGALVPGRWIVKAGLDERVPSQVHLGVKRDEDLLRGALTARVLLASQVQDDPVLRTGTEEALRRWAENIYRPLGIDLTVTIERWNGPSELGSPGFNDPEAYRQASEGKALREVVVLVLENIADASRVYGASGGIPGPLVVSDRSVVAVSALEAVGGGPLEFADWEIDLFAETLAHEVGHYLGLFHTNELPKAGRIQGWDDLDDTPECVDFDECRDLLGDNLMFPAPVCDAGEDTCSVLRAQRTLTASQVGILHRNPHLR